MSQMHILITFHVLSAIIWVGGMIAIRLVVHPLRLSWEDEQIRISRNLAVTKRLLLLAFPFVLIAVGTGILLSNPLKGAAIASLVNIKEGIWLVMTLNFFWIAVRRNIAQRAFNNFDLFGARRVMQPLANFFLPLNIILGLLALWFGVSLRGV